MSNPKPAVGILRINSENECWDGLHVVCDCGTPDHAIDIHVAVNHDRSDPQWPFTEAEFFVKMYTLGSAGVGDGSIETTPLDFGDLSLKRAE